MTDEKSQLESLDVDSLRAILAQEESDCAALKKKCSEIESIYQTTSQEKELQEERILNLFGKKIKQLKQENLEISKKIQNEERYVKSTLTEKYNEVLRDKQKLLDVLNYQEQMVIEKLQVEIERMTQEATNLEVQLKSHELGDVQIERDKVDESLENIIKGLDKNKIEYEKELQTLRTEVERMITANSVLFKRISMLQMELISRSKLHWLAKKRANEDEGRPTDRHEERGRRHSDIPENLISMDEIV